MTVTSDDNAKELKLLKIISKFWSPKLWAQYLKQIESKNTEEEIYVGSTNELEKYVTRKSKTGFVPAESIERVIEFKQAKKFIKK